MHVVVSYRLVNVFVVAYAVVVAQYSIELLVTGIFAVEVAEASEAFANGSVDTVVVIVLRVE